jgi:phospholipid-binding lipoprotein MlaA
VRDTFKLFSANFSSKIKLLAIALAVFLSFQPAAFAEDGQIALVAGEVGPQISADFDDIIGEMDEEEDTNDPLEPLNRVFFTFNDYFYTWILSPITDIYTILPSPVRTSLGNMLDNISSPIVLANDILQGDFMRAWETTERVVINSTLGIGGLFDAADSLLGIEEHSEDFGQTLGVWGVGEGLYLVLPILGPSSPRDAIGKYVVDSFFDPLNMWALNTDRDYIPYSRGGLSAVHEYSEVREELDQVKKTSIDFYAAIRSMYRQKRKSEIENNEEITLPPIPDLTYEFDEDEYDLEADNEGSMDSLADR